MELFYFGIGMKDVFSKGSKRVFTTKDNDYRSRDLTST